jgi:hypothetical protein
MKALSKTRKDSISHNLGVLGLCLLITIVFILPLSCGKKAGPGDTVEQFFSAFKEGDVEKAIRLTDADEQIIEQVIEHSDQINAAIEREFEGRDFEYKVISEEIDGFEAKVKAQIKTESGEVRKYTLLLNEIDGEWRIDNDSFEPDEYE